MAILAIVIGRLNNTVESYAAVEFRRKNILSGLGERYESSENKQNEIMCASQIII